MNLENITKLLSPGEQILWASKPVPGNLMDSKNKTRNLRWFIIVGAAFALLMFFYAKACIRAGTSVFSVVTIVFILMAAIIFLDPVTTFNKLKKTEYAITNQRVIVCERTTENGGKPFGILTNGVTKTGTKSITWLTQIDGSAASAQVKYSTNRDLSDATTVKGDSTIQTFVQSSRGDALRSNKVTLTDLTPGTTYYYRVGDGTTWSDTQSFKTPAANAEATNFFILGDIQSSDTSNLAHVLDVLKTSETAYDFALQTGDAIDNVTEYVKNWRPSRQLCQARRLCADAEQ